MDEPAIAIGLIFFLVFMLIGSMFIFADTPEEAPAPTEPNTTEVRNANLIEEPVHLAVDNWTRRPARTAMAVI